MGTNAWAAPMTSPASPLIRDGGVVFENDRVIAWDNAQILANAHPDASRIDLGAAIILPGLVNAHTHLELSSCAAGDSPASFVDWILSTGVDNAVTCDRNAVSTPWWVTFVVAAVVRAPPVPMMRPAAVSLPRV